MALVELLGLQAIAKIEKKRYSNITDIAKLGRLDVVQPPWESGPHPSPWEPGIMLLLILGIV